LRLSFGIFTYLALHACHQLGKVKFGLLYYGRSTMKHNLVSLGELNCTL